MYELWPQITTWAWRILFAGALVASPFLLRLPLPLVLTALTVVLVLTIGHRILMNREFKNAKNLAWWIGSFMTTYWVALGLYCLLSIYFFAVYDLHHAHGLGYGFFTWQHAPALVDIALMAALGIIPIWEMVVYPLAGKVILQTIGTAEMTDNEIYRATYPIQEFVVCSLLKHYSKFGYLHRRTEECGRCRCENTFYRLTEEGRRFRNGLRITTSRLRAVGE